MNNQQILFIGSFITVAVVAALFWPPSDIEKPQASATTIMESSNSMVQTPEGAILVTMYKNEGCMCCTRWAEHMNKEGFYVTEEYRQLGAIKSEQGTNELASCHTAMIDGYVVEDMFLLPMFNGCGRTSGCYWTLSSWHARGISGRPNPNPYDVLLINSDGSTSVFSSYR